MTELKVLSFFQSIIISSSGSKGKRRVVRVRKFSIFLSILFISLSIEVKAAHELRPGDVCIIQAKMAEIQEKIPKNLLVAISLVETGRKDPVTGKFKPWPWSINAEGKGYFFSNKRSAVQAAKKLVGKGKSIDVGCMQINLNNHPKAFKNMEEAFDPAHNVNYGAKFLKQLYEKGKSWVQSVGNYHSANHTYSGPYRKKVYAKLAHADSITFNKDIKSIMKEAIHYKGETSPYISHMNVVYKPTPPPQLNMTHFNNTLSYKINKNNAKMINATVPVINGRWSLPKIVVVSRT